MNSATSSKKPRYSVVIVTYNSRENIRVCLDSLRRCSGTAKAAGAGGGLEIIVVDNNSRDGTQAYLSAQEDIRTVLNGGNNGFSKGCNQGAEIATGDFLIFLNPDTMVTPDWADNMARYFQDPSVGAVGPVSNYVAGLQRLDLNLPAEWKDAKQFPGTGAEEIADNVAGILKRANAGRGVITKILIGFCFMIQRPLYSSMGGMDENLFLGNDDLDLSWRLRNIGRKLIVASDSFVFHEGQKSFKTEAKTHVDRLTQESTDALYVKLVEHYGGADRVPSPTELWGIGWFSPSPSLIQKIKDEEMQEKSRQPEAKVKSETRELTVWKGISALIYAGPETDAADAEGTAARLERSLATLPSRPGPDIVILNCSGHDVQVDTPAGAILRKLDLGSGCTPKQALEIAINLLPGTHALFCMAGVEFSTLFNHWLDKRELPALGQAMPLPLRIESSGSESESAYAFLCRKDWLRTALGSMTENPDAGEFLARMGQKLRENLREKTGGSDGKPMDPPWLLIDGRALPNSGASPSVSAKESWTPVKSAPAAPVATAMPSLGGLKGNLMDALKHLNGNATADRTPERAAEYAPAPITEKIGDAVGLYPESLRPALRLSKDVGFAGTVADMPPAKGGFKVYNAKGDLVPLADQDLVILRVTPDLIDGLADRIRNIRALGRNLKRLVAIFDGAQARGLKSSPQHPLTPVDLTADGIRAALLSAGFTVTGVQPYRGFPEFAKTGALEGWSQVEAVPRDAAFQTQKLVSIVILGFNQVAYTKKCIESIRKYTRQKYELILVDNGSKDGTEEYFRSIAGAKVIHNPVNLGVAKGWNQGMRLAEGDFILILNNDIIVGPDWLENMVRLAETDPTIGLVGPRSNYIAGPQIVPDVPYKAESEIQGFISKWQAEHAMSAAEFGFIKGFCHLIPRRVFAKVGFYDERFGKGNFEDDDYCMRVHCHGFRALMANDSFIHHYGSVSFNQESVDWQALMIENQKKYQEKWSKGPSAMHDTLIYDAQPAVPAAPAAAPVSKAPASFAPAGYTSVAIATAPSPLSAASAPAAPIAISASAPARTADRAREDGKRAYASGDVPGARNFFLEAQGKEPLNPEIYCDLGIMQFHLNALQEASILFLKCLELDPTHADAALNLFDTILAGNGKITPTEARTLKGRFPANRIIAEVASDILGLPAPAPAAAAPAPLPAWRVELEGYIAKADHVRALDLIETRLKSAEDSGTCYNYLGIIAHACGDKSEALRHFTTAAKYAPFEPDIVYNLADTLIALGRAAEASRYLAERAGSVGGSPADPQIDFGASAEQLAHALEDGKADGERLLASREANQKGESLLRSGNADGAKDLFQAAVREDGRDFRAHNNLGLTAWYRERGEEAWKHFTDALAIRPAWTDALINAFDTALSLGCIEAMKPYLDKAAAAKPDHAEAAAMRAHVLADGPAIYSGMSFEGLQEGSAVLKRAEKAMKEGRQSEAIQTYMEALQLRPKNPQAMNGLGIIAFGEKRYTDAYGLFEAAAGMHPLEQDILMNLWQCAQALRREVDVLPQLKLSLEQDPDLEDVRAVVREYA